MQLANNKGFTILELLITLLIIPSLFLITLPKSANINLDYLTFMNKYLALQTDSIVNSRSNYLSNDYGKYTVNFNESGKVNMAQTINFDHTDVIIHLGNGYITYE